ncbi:hypothetical protein CbuD7D7780_10240 [Coxiella burnetii]|uniref:Hypothetical membrane associated protein n=1 Tax=Coxiella burnetii (strain Dugway 5J108-111) TaxID=434922 RepID=A9KES5_COXBN|nr:CBU_0122 family Dot/Icm T4SS effector [Coxiella burnetii]ABS76807.1 hypothetical membrane associated protein [Coxiella burnetii Dugway 5J108-111]OYK81536.1 hypothetical protein CbuD7D7780_10240 [Coxiella burnetii]
MSTANNCVDYMGHFLRGSLLGGGCGVAVACFALMLVSESAPVFLIGGTIVGGFAFAGGTGYSLWKHCRQPEEEEKSLLTREGLPELFFYPQK